MLLLRRYLLLTTLMCWQGGFFFYAAVVVPIGTQVFDQHYRPLGSDSPSGRRQQGRITRSVAWWVNLSGGVALIAMGWDVFASRDTGRRRSWRAVLWIVAAAVLAALSFLYGQMDALFNRDTLALTDPPAFLTRHRLYLWLLAAQWGSCLLYLLLTLAAWRAEDSATAKYST